MKNEQTEKASGIVVATCVSDGRDYTVGVRRPDGSVVHVLIPHETSDGFPNECVSKCDGPFGLNLVSDGHYL